LGVVHVPVHLWVQFSKKKLISKIGIHEKYAISMVKIGACAGLSVGILFRGALSGKR
jgi:hypothetical protein